MIDFDETGLYKGFVKNQRGKKFSGRNPQLLTLPEADAFDSFSGIMYPNVVLIDADECFLQDLFAENCKIKM